MGVRLPPPAPDFLISYLTDTSLPISSINDVLVVGLGFGLDGYGVGKFGDVEVIVHGWFNVQPHVRQIGGTFEGTVNKQLLRASWTNVFDRSMVSVVTPSRPFSFTGSPLESRRSQPKPTEL